MKSLLIPLLALSLAACGQARAPEQPAAVTVTVADAWCRPTPNGAKVGGCYVSLTASADDRLISVSTDAAPITRIHDMTVEDGMMRMHAMEDGLPLPAGQTIILAPGGKHLMLMGLTAPLVEGTAITLGLTFEHAPRARVQAAVRQPLADDGHAGH